MIVLDTNVVSKLMHPTGAPLEKWISLRRGEFLCMSVLTITEVTYGLHLLPHRRRREHVEAGWHHLQHLWAGRILPVTPEVAQVAGVAMADRRAIGRPIHVPDALIAATCLLHDATLATRNTREFEGLGIDLINPWDDAPSM